MSHFYVALTKIILSGYLKMVSCLDQAIRFILYLFKALIVESSTDSLSFNKTYTTKSETMSRVLKINQLDITENNVHLQQLDTNHKEIFEKWKQTLSFDLEELGVDEDVDERSGIKERIRYSFAQGHLDGEKYVYLSKYLEGDISFLESLRKEHQALSVSRSGEEEELRFKQLSFQNKCIELLNCSNSR